MKTFTIQDIRALKPCTDPTKWVPEDWTGTIADILGMPNVRHSDKLWVTLRFLPVMSRVAFALYNGRTALKCVKNPDPRSVAACDAVEGYIQGTVSKEQLLTARNAVDAVADAADAVADAADAATYATHAAAYKMARIKAEELQCDFLRILAEQAGDK
jgi:hypothetical protein